MHASNHLHRNCVPFSTQFLFDESILILSYLALGLCESESVSYSAVSDCATPWTVACQAQARIVVAIRIFLDPGI